MLRKLFLHLAEYGVLLTAPIVNLILLVFAINLSVAVLSTKLYRYYSAKKSTTLSSSANLDESAVFFAAKTQNIAVSTDCFPVHVSQHHKVNVLYLYCSDEAQKRDHQEVKISEDFTVQKELAPIFNFWRRIYSLWGEDQYVLHIADYPEVVLEVADGSHLDPTLNWRQKEKRIKDVLNKHRWEYKSMLRKMHKHRFEEKAKFGHGMRRIAKAMRHIKDPNKYLIAANSVRIQRGQRDQTALGLSRASRYMPAIRKVFRDQNLSEQLSYLAFVESSFNLKAISKVGASGVYQIMPATGRMYLIVNNEIDERRDPIKSAFAAARILKENFSKTQSWPLAITAYNHGLGSVKRAIRQTGTKEIYPIIKTYRNKNFGFASKNFYLGFMAMLATIEDRAKIFPTIETVAPIEFQNYRLRKATSISEIRKTYNITNEVLRDYNPDITRRFVLRNGILPKNFVVKIPLEEKKDEHLLNAGYAQ